LPGPPPGALAAWAGLHLLALLQGLGIVSLTGVLPVNPNYRMATTAPVLGITVLLGFSERLFNQLGDHADTVLLGEQGDSPATAGSPTATPVPSPIPSQREPGGHAAV